MGGFEEQFSVVSGPGLFFFCVFTARGGSATVFWVCCFSLVLLLPMLMYFVSLFSCYVSWSCSGLADVSADWGGGSSMLV